MSVIAPKRRVMGIAVDMTAQREYEGALRVYEGLKSQRSVLAGQMGEVAATNALAQAGESLERASMRMKR
jgi:hypothetical protein